MPTVRKTLQVLTVAVLLTGTAAFQSASAWGSGGSGGGTQVDTIKVSKCYYDAPTGEMLIKAGSSDPNATLHAYFVSGMSLGYVQNGGGGRYGGTVMGFVGFVDPVYIVILSSSGGSIVVPTTPFQP
jgi:hypothetical protein